MPLNGYIEVPGTATVGGAPIDAFQADAFRQNDGLFERLLRSILSTPFITNDGSQGPQNNPDPEEIVRATTITITDDRILTEKVPLIWLATEKITIDSSGGNNGKITAQGKGAQPGEDGDFGGSGGGGANAGHPCKLPISGHEILAGGGVGLAGGNLLGKWAIRALSMLAFGRGGAAGGDDGANSGGAGGGVVILCAPEIEIIGAGEINAKGADGGGGNAGGGGGGLVVLIAREKTNVNTTGPNQNIHVDGGAGQGTGGNGGNGFVLELPFP